MSLILEALKKSEAERRLGQVPGLMTPVQRTLPRRASRAPALLVLLLAIMTIAAVGWWWTRREILPAAVLHPEAAPAALAPESSLPASDPLDVATTSVAIADPRSSAPAAALPAELPSDPDFVSNERESRPVTANAPPPIEATSPALPAPQQPLPVSATPAPHSRVAPSRPDAPRPETSATSPRATAMNASLPAAPDVAQMPAATEEVLEPLPRLVDLPANERDTLPPLKLTMHVYAADAAARFVLIDGQRLGQGERLSPALTLTEIRRDGAVFEFDGRRFLVPRL